MLVSEHVYTSAGWQRPVVMVRGTHDVRFAGEGLAAIQICYDGREEIRRGKAAWVTHEAPLHDGFGGGHEIGIGGLRVKIGEGGGRLVVVERS